MEQMNHINKTRLDALRVEAVNSTKKFLRLKDPRVKSFFWQANQKGSVVGVIRYNFNGSDKVFVVAEFGSEVTQYTVSGVISKAMKTATEIRNGGDPQATHREAKKERSLSRSLSPQKRVLSGDSVEGKANEYYQQNTSLPRSKKLARAALDNIVTAFGYKLVNDVTREDVVKLLISLQDRGAEGNYSVAEMCQKYGAAMWTWGLDQGGFHCINHFAAMKSFKKKYSAAAKKNADKNLMTKDNAREMVKTHYRGFSKGVQRTIILQAYTACRPMSATSADRVVAGGPIFPIDWSEFNIEDGTWHIPAMRMKGRERSHLVDMPQQLIAHIKLWHKQDGCPSKGLVVQASRSPYGALTSATLGSAYIKRELGYTPHKWRHFASSFIGELGGGEIAELVLGHYKNNAYHKVTRRVDRAKYLQIWADELDKYGFDKLLPRE